MEKHKRTLALECSKEQHYTHAQRNTYRYVNITYTHFHFDNCHHHLFTQLLVDYPSDVFNQTAPDSLDSNRKLLQSILKACEQIQQESEYHGGKEDNRNRRIRDTLENWGYEVYD